MALEDLFNVDEKAARITEARARQAEAETRRQTAIATRDESVQLAEMQYQQELYNMQTTQLQDRTYSAFDRYSSDHDVKHLNNFLAEAKKNPVGANLTMTISV